MNKLFVSLTLRLFVSYEIFCSETYAFRPKLRNFAAGYFIIHKNDTQI